MVCSLGCVWVAQVELWCARWGASVDSFDIRREMLYS